ncbi:hypothetical protein LTR10_009142 [Elasticomyces elasticus]|nr:hypothetical protein LTR10_009142 [Elasticomyces elasticus]KAK4971754.1 hypothetical protein LTR42_007482 [Elasticomyces elasticus]
MKITAYLATMMASMAIAAPTQTMEAALTKRQFGLGSSTSNELEEGKCGKVVGSSVGPPTCSGLKDAYSDDDVVCQGVGGAYTAGLSQNALPGGSSSGAFAEAARLFELAATQCPESIIVTGGYSQGSAVINGAVSKLDSAVQSQVAGAVLYGYTRNAQNDGGIENYPKDQVKVFCAVSDGVCGGALLVTAGHFTYAGDVDEAVEFLVARIDAA